MYRMWKSYPEGKTCEVKLIQGSEPVEMQKTARQYGLQHECGISLLHLAPGPPTTSVVKLGSYLGPCLVWVQYKLDCSVIFLKAQAAQVFKTL